MLVSTTHDFLIHETMIQTCYISSNHNMSGIKVDYKIRNDYLTITYVRNHNLHLQVGYTTSCIKKSRQATICTATTTHVEQSL